MMKRWGMTVLKITVSATLLFVLFGRVDTGEFLKMVSSANPLPIIFAAAVYGAAQCLSAYRWSTILKDDVEVKYGTLLSMYFIGMFFNNFLPTAVGGDFIKGYYLYRKTGKGDVASASILMDRYSGFVALMTITLASLLAGWRLVYGIGGAALISVFLILIGGFIGASFFLWFEGLHGWFTDMMGKVRLFGLNRKLDTFYRVFMGYKKRKDVLLKTLLFSFAIQTGVIICYFAVGRGIGMSISIGWFFLFIPLATSSAMIPLSLSGLGIREGVLVFLFTRAGATKEEALSMGIVFFIVILFISMAGAFEYVRSGIRKEGITVAGGTYGN
ncbi:MAG: flippase-like domain-containing protein [Deltaproteobacteria bacterium]|nr:flippase-like domain-containing protein [Deltaproteobacteria bacterium]